MKVLLFDDTPANISAFNNVKDNTSNPIDKALKSSSDVLLKRFVARGFHLNLCATHVTTYNALANNLKELGLMSDSSDNARESLEPTILLLDCQIGTEQGDNREGQGILPILKQLSPCKKFVVVLATSFTTGTILPVVRDEASTLHPFIVQDHTTNCFKENRTIENITKGIRLWESLQGGPYDAFFTELLKGENTRHYSSHPPNGENERKNLCTTHFSALIGKNAWKFVDRQIYELAAFDLFGGVGVEGAYCLSLMKACELFPEIYHSDFIENKFEGYSPADKSERSKKRPFILKQTRDARLASIFAFGHLCKTHFVKKTTLNVCALNSIEMKGGYDNQFKKMEWNLGWCSQGSYAKNVILAYDCMQKFLDGSVGGIGTQHDASCALVSFILSTTQVEQMNSRHHLRGTSINVSITEDSNNNITQLIFED